MFNVYYVTKIAFWVIHDISLLLFKTHEHELSLYSFFSPFIPLEDTTQESF